MGRALTPMNHGFSGNYPAFRAARDHGGEWGGFNIKLAPDCMFGPKFGIQAEYSALAQPGFEGPGNSPPRK